MTSLVVPLTVAVQIPLLFVWLLMAGLAVGVQVRRLQPINIVC